MLQTFGDVLLFIVHQCMADLLIERESMTALETLTTSEQSTQLSILPRSVNEYSELTLRVQALDTH